MDTSIWVDHFRGAPSAERLRSLLEAEQVLTHPHIIGELVLGGLGRQSRALLSWLPAAPAAAETEVLSMVDAQELAGCAIGWVDAHLLASARLAGAGLWTGDGALASVADRLLGHR